jgi:aminoglycoside 6-adenylyltransferase
MDNKQLENKIIDFAKKDNRVRAILLNGSRANPNSTPDRYQDFDLLFIVHDIESFIADKNWTSFLGKILIQQLPDSMLLGADPCEDKVTFAYLMIFEDEYRVDLTLFPKDKFHSNFKPDSLTKVWLDKDLLFKNINPPSDQDYHIEKPTERIFQETCNEFWWVSTYIAKGLARKEIFYAKDMMESVVRPMLMNLIAWHIGFEKQFQVSFGKSGKFAEKYLDPDLYRQVLNTYADSSIENNWLALIQMMDIFRKLERELATQFGYAIDFDEADNAYNYIVGIKDTK